MPVFRFELLFLIEEWELKAGLLFVFHVTSH